MVLRLYGWSTGNGINLLQGFELSFLIRSYSIIVNVSLLSSNDGSESLGRPSIRRLLVWMLSNSSTRYFGIPPQIGAPYSIWRRLRRNTIKHCETGGNWVPLKEFFDTKIQHRIAYYNNARINQQNKVCFVRISTSPNTVDQKTWFLSIVPLRQNILLLSMRVITLLLFSGFFLVFPSCKHILERNRYEWS